MKFLNLALLAIICIAACAIAQPSLGDEVTPFGSQIPWPSDSDIDTHMDRLQEAGVQWARSEIIWWGLCESTPGSYEFVQPNVEGWESWNADHWVDGLLERGIRPYAILAYGNAVYNPNPENPADWLPPTTPESVAAYAEWAYQTATHYADRVDVWEIWNEPNLAHFWGNVPPNAQDYTALVAAAAPRIHEVDPAAIVVGGVVSGIDLRYLEQCFQAGMLEHVDAVSIHPYRTQKPESIADEVAQVRELIATHAPEGKEIFLFTGEWGYNTFWSEVDEQGHAKCVSRMIVNNLSLGIDLSIWFSVHAFQEADPAGEDSEWGLVNRDLSRRPAFFAMRTLNQRLHAPIAHIDDPYDISLDPALSDARVEVFERGDETRRTIALWLARWPVNAEFTPEVTDIHLTLPRDCLVMAYDGLTGEPVDLNIDRDGESAVIRDFQMRDYPVFVEVNPMMIAPRAEETP